MTFTRTPTETTQNADSPVRLFADHDLLKRLGRVLPALAYLSRTGDLE